MAAALTLWLPICFRFLNSWTKRDNPISLAIAAAVMLIVWELVSHLGIFVGHVPAKTASTAYAVLAVLVGFYFNLSFIWAQKKFPSDREE